MGKTYHKFRGRGVLLTDDALSQNDRDLLGHIARRLEDKALAFYDGYYEQPFYMFGLGEIQEIDYERYNKRPYMEHFKDQAQTEAFISDYLTAVTKQARLSASKVRFLQKLMQENAAQQIGNWDFYYCL